MAMSSNIGINLELKPNEVRSFLRELFKTQPSCVSRSYYHLKAEKASKEELSKLKVCPPTIMLWGPPGIGKSAVVQEAAVDAGIPLENYADIRLSTLEPVDLRGVPSVVNGRTIYNPPSFFPIGQNEIDELLRKYNIPITEDREENLRELSRVLTREKVEKAILDKIENAIKQDKGVILFDELPSAAHDIQVAAYEIILDRKIGSYTLPIGWAIVAAGNRSKEVGAETSSYLPVPLANRMVHIGVDLNPKDWQEWAIDHGFNNTVVAFGLQELKSDATQEKKGFGPGEQENAKGVPAFLTPRSLEWLDYIDKQIEQGILNNLGLDNDEEEKERVGVALYRGAIGAQEAIRFNYLKKTLLYLLTAKEMYDHPDIAKEFNSILLKKDDLTDNDIETLAKLKARASGESESKVISNYKNNFKTVYDQFYKTAIVARTYLPVFNLIEEDIVRLSNNSADKDKFINAVSSIVSNSTRESDRSVLGLIEALGYKLGKYSVGNIEAQKHAASFQVAIENARKKRK